MEKSKRVPYRYCAVKYCGVKTSVNNLDVHFFSLPKDPTRRAIWIEKCVPELADQNTILQGVKICQEHFEDKMFLNINLKNRLTDFAVPTLFNDHILAKRVSNKNNDSFLDVSAPLACLSPNRGSSSSSVNTSDSSSQTQSYLSSSTPRKLQLRKELQLAKDQIRALEKKLYKLNHLDSAESFLNQCKQFLSPNLVLIIKSHLMTKERKKSGYRYSKEMKQFALTIYFLGPKVYNFIKKTLSLPAICTLKR